MKAIIPFKKEGAKSRLIGFLNEDEREELAINMLKDVLIAVSESKIEEVEVISTGSSLKKERIKGVEAGVESEEELNSLSVLDLKLELAVDVTVDKRGLNEVLNEAIIKERERLLILMADIPLTTPRSINEIIAHEEDRDKDVDEVIVPGRNGGTNALFLRRPRTFSVSYYGMSYLKHIETAKKRNLNLAVHDSFFISTDIDEVEDLVELLIHGNGFSAEYLDRIGVFICMDKGTKRRASVDRKIFGLEGK